MPEITVKEFQQLMIDLYGERDKRRGIEKSLLWLQSEQGELIQAYLKGDKTEMEEEVADIFAWLCSVCNLLDIDLGAVSTRKYPYKCSKCNSNPCKCPEL
ncbi:MAG: MazG nucleotide pyrophosphohydrolase domain-containing protein [Candidatus Hodarchaeales archaeon]